MLRPLRYRRGEAVCLRQSVPLGMLLLVVAMQASLELANGTTIVARAVYVATAGQVSFLC